MNLRKMDSQTFVKAGFLVIVFLITSTIFLSESPSADEVSMESYLASEGFSSEGIENYTFQNTDDKVVSGINIREGEAEGSKGRFEIKILSDVSSTFAANYLDDRRNKIVSMYTNTPSPYEAVPERVIECASGLQPTVEVQTREGTNYTYYDLYADQNYNLGVCSQQDVEYRTEIVTMYCPTQDKILEASLYYSPDQNNSKIIDSLRCNNS